MCPHNLASRSCSYRFPKSCSRRGGAPIFGNKGPLRSLGVRDPLQELQNRANVKNLSSFCASRHVKYVRNGQNEPHNYMVFGRDKKEVPQIRTNLILSYKMKETHFSGPELVLLAKLLLLSLSLSSFLFCY